MPGVVEGTNMCIQSYYELALDQDFGALLISTGFNWHIGSLLDRVLWQRITIAAPYISTLIQSVDFKQNTFKTKEIKLGSFNFTFPQSVELGGFSVTFQEDALSSVRRFYDDWIGTIMNDRGIFKNLKAYSLSFIFLRMTGMKIPTYTDIFPRVYPIRIKESTASYGSDDLKTFTIDFVRVVNTNTGMFGKGLGITF